ncbi:sulfate adenylate transferase [Neisseria gonorrhoeae]|uniref:elongation factor 1-alpha C-terminal domain-related protein n=1 Tax=Neisseria gonorrhoeae TaxID=485 RepID=UPI0001AF5C58|nr:NAD(P)-dependent oxidoreductase [Neisseria gonorrhoeae]EEZ59255.1 sulphate adenylate transferase subunit 1 [Neisseria gonorrhoeae SK-93-1035]STZ93908.1 sulfate adenylate transferase subunit 1 [Neisseria gonorrhoeae]
MNYFPIFANLSGRPVLVVGGGAVAARKISLLPKAGAEVGVAAKHLNAELSALAAENKILWLAKEFRAEHIRTVFLIIAASSDQALNRRVFHLAESCQKPVNVVGDRDHCSFIFPSVIDRDPVQIAVSSSGSAPVLARLLRERLEALLPPSLGDMAEISGRWRDAGFYFPVQLVVRQDADKADGFRGYQGRIERGSVTVGQTVRIEPNGLTAEVSEIIAPKGEVAQAFAGEAATIRLDRDIDVSRGDLFVDKNSPLAPQKHPEATLCWFDERPLNTARKYLLKHGTQTVPAKVGEIESVLDVRTLEQEAGAESLKMNDIAKVRINLQKPVTATPYAENTAAGSFILIDEATYGTVAAGMIL